MSSVFSSIRRTPYQSLASFLILFFTLFLMSALFVIISFLHGLLEFVEGRPQVIVYFQTAAEEVDILSLRDELYQSGKVTDITYMSKEQAFEVYKEQTKDNPLLLEMTSPDILPASLEVFATEPEYLTEIAEYLRTQPGVDEVQFQEIVVERLLNLTNMVRAAAFILFGFLIFMTVIVIITTISFKIALKKDEIEILKLIGASNFYIKKPFMFEAMFIGVFAGIIACSTLFGIFFFMNPAFQGFLGGITQLSTNFISFLPLTVWPATPIFILVTYGITSLFGLIIAFIGSFIATAKYLS